MFTVEYTDILEGQVLKLKKGTPHAVYGPARENYNAHFGALVVYSTIFILEMPPWATYCMHIQNWLFQFMLLTCAFWHTRFKIPFGLFVFPCVSS